MADDSWVWNAFNALGVDQKALKQYFSRSTHELSQIPKDVKEFVSDNGKAASEILTGLLPGSGLVQGQRDFAVGSKDLREGNYGKAAVDYLSGTGNVLLEMAPGAKAAIPAGKTFLSILAGIGARNAPKADLRLAEEMEKAGMGKDQIWQASGWERGKDGKWRWEIPDQEAKLNQDNFNSFGPKPNTRLKDILQHPQLYEAYPDIGNLPITPQGGYGGTYGGTYIGLGQNKDPLSVLLHEAQHGVQGTEGFAPGGNPSYISGIWAMEREKQIKAAQNSEENARLMTKYLDDIPKATQAAQNTYRKIAGETEARNVQTRAGRDPLLNAKQRPELTEDRSRAEQIVPYYQGQVPRPESDSFTDKIMGLYK